MVKARESVLVVRGVTAGQKRRLAAKARAGKYRSVSAYVREWIESEIDNKGNEKAEPSRA